MGKWGNDVGNVVGCADRAVFACTCGGDCVAAGCVVQMPPHGLKRYQAVVWGVSGMALFYMYLPFTYTVLATASQSLPFNSEIERLRELCESGLFVVWGVMLLPFISRLMLLKGLDGEGYRGYLDNWAYVWGMWLAFAYLGVWWLGYVSEWIRGVS